MRLPIDTAQTMSHSILGESSWIIVVQALDLAEPALPDSKKKNFSKISLDAFGLPADWYRNKKNDGE